MAYGPTNAPGVDGTELEQIKNLAENAVPKERTVNGKPLKENICLTVSDIEGAVPASEKGAANGVAVLDADGRVPAEQLPSLCPYVVGTAEPADKLKLWIDTTPETGGLKYFNGSAWVNVPVSYT